jgi:hypothetical protein
LRDLTTHQRGVQNGGRIFLGVLTAPGTINILGNYAQLSSGYLVIPVSPQGAYGVLNVQANQGQGGAVTLNGTLQVQNEFYAPNAGTLTFMNYANLTGDFATASFDVPMWEIDNQYYLFVLIPGQNNYALTVSAT